jgi:malonyl-CoA O-methyltransferase
LINAEIKIKEKIRRSFNKAVKTYDQHCCVQNQVADVALNMLVNYQINFSHIVDLACGTGESTKRLINSVHYMKCSAIDFAESALLLAKNKLSEHESIEFVLGDFDEELFPHACLDLIFCNMGLQWSKDLPSSISFLKHYLLSEGIMLFSIPIMGNFPEIKGEHKLRLPSDAEVIEIIQEEKLNVIDNEIHSISIDFNSQLEVLKSLKYVGANYNKLDAVSKAGLLGVKAQDIFRDQDSKSLTYNVGIYLLNKGEV